MRRGTGRILAVDARVLAEPSGGLRRYGEEALPRLAALAERHGFQVVIVSGDAVTGVAWPASARLRRLPGFHRSSLRWIWERCWLPRRLLRARATAWYSPLGTTVPVRDGLRQVVLVHDLGFLDDSIELPQHHRRYWSGTLARVHRADAVVTPSKTTAQQLLDYDPSVQEVVALAHGVDHAAATGSMKLPTLRRRDQLEVLWIGTLDRRKNVGFLMDVCRRLRESGLQLRLVVVGREGNDRRVVGRLRAESSWVEWTGPVSERVLGERLARATVLVCPSLDEGFGLPVAEAMGAGLPVVVSDRGALPEVVGGAGVVLPLDRDLWALELARILKDPDRLADLARRAAARSAIWTWERHVHGVARLLDRRND